MGTPAAPNSSTDDCDSNEGQRMTLAQARMLHLAGAKLQFRSDDTDRWYNVHSVTWTTASPDFIPKGMFRIKP